MTVNLPKKVMAAFRKRAVRVFPKEKFAYIVGHRITEDEIQVVEMYYPEQIGTDSNVSIIEGGLTAAMEYAAARKLIVLGSLHTHCYSWAEYKGSCFEPVLSIGDAVSWGDTDLVCGVLNLVENAKGRKLTSLAFWGQPSLCRVERK